MKSNCLFLLLLVLATQVQLNWVAPEVQDGEMIVSYSVWRGGSPALPKPTRVANNVTATTYTDLKPVAGTRYYEVRANITLNGVPQTTGPSNIVKVVFP